MVYALIDLVGAMSVAHQPAWFNCPDKLRQARLIWFSIGHDTDTRHQVELVIIKWKTFRQIHYFGVLLAIACIGYLQHLRGKVRSGYVLEGSEKAKKRCQQNTEN